MKSLLKARLTLVIFSLWVPLSLLHGGKAFGQEVEGQGSAAYVFARVEEGFSQGRVSAFSAFLAPLVLLDLRGGESGEFSGKQTHYLLANHFKGKAFAPFTFSSVETAGPAPYATGSAEFTYKGTRLTAQVYVALSVARGRYVIAQLKIY